MIPTFHIKDLIDAIGPDKFAGFHRQVALQANVMRSLLTELFARREAKPSYWLWRNRGDNIWNLAETYPTHLNSRQDVGKFEIKPLYEEYKP